MSTPQTFALPALAWEFKGEQVELPAAADLTLPLGEALRQRGSNRAFSRQPMTRQDIGTLLRHAVGFRGFSFAESFGIVARRNYPSPGSRHSLEFFILAIHCADVLPGLYHLRYDCSALTALGTMPPPDVQRLVGEQPWAREAATVVMMASVQQRQAFKYPKSARRFGLLEAGHAGQSLALVATAMGLSHCALGSLPGKALDEQIGLVEDDHEWVTALAIGWPT